MKMHDNSKVSGFFRLNIVEHDSGEAKVVGDSGWLENQITNYGYESCIVGRVGSVASVTPVYPQYVALGSGTTTASNATGLGSELTGGTASSSIRVALTPTAVSSKTARFVGTLTSGYFSTTQAIQNIGLFAVSSITQGTIIAGQTYTQSTLQSNQSVNCTYELRFS
jgi:hypothetical protein